jgi:ABC-type lipoprotein export system ATPase subunit
MIRIEQLEFAYERNGFRLSIPELQVDSGEKVAVIGPSGSGKTTLLNLLSGITIPHGGRVDVSGFDAASESDDARRRFRITQIGFVFQDFELIEYLSVLDNILHPYRLNNALRLDADVARRAETLARETGIADKLRRYPHQLSQGERQRAALCRALLPEPKLILADEPTGNLDPASKETVMHLIFEQAERAGATLIAVTHDHTLLGGFDRVIDFADFTGSAAHAG